jgi:hypothetical protein
MSSFTYYANIPNAPDNPSFDQPLMQTNATSINGIIAVDHVTFNIKNPSGGGATPGQGGGQHLQVTFNSKNVPGGAPTDPLSIMYTNNVSSGASNTASASTVASVFYQNANAIFPVSMIRAFGSFDNTATSLNTWNMTAVRNSAGSFTITMPNNVCTGTNYLIIVSNTGNGSNTSLANSYTITSATQFTLIFLEVGVAFQDPDKFSVMVLQL